MTTGESGLIVIELFLDIRARIRVTNGTAEVVRDKPFCLFVSNVSRTSKCLPRNVVIYISSKRLLEVSEIPEDMGQEFEKCINTFKATRDKSESHFENLRN